MASGFEDDDVFWYRSGSVGGSIAFEAFTTGLTPAPYDLAVVENGFGYTTGLALVMTAGDFSNGLELEYQVPLGDPTVSWISWRIADDFPGGTQGRISPTDFNGDGRNDVAVASTEFSTIRVYLSNQGGGWSPVDIETGYEDLVDVASGDLDGNGTPDIVAGTSGRSGVDRISWWPNK